MDRRHSTRSALVIAALFVAIPLVFIAGVAIFQLVKNVPDARDARAKTVLAFQTLTIAKAVDEAIQDAERGQRGYLITGQEVYLRPLCAGERERLSGLVLDLQRAVGDDPEQQHRVLTLQADITTKMNELAETVGLMRVRGFDAAKDIVLTDARAARAWRRSAPILRRSPTRPTTSSGAASKPPRSPRSS